MPPLLAVSVVYGALMDTTPAALTLIGGVPVIAPPPLDVTHVGQVRLPVVGLRTNGALAPSASVPEVVGSVRGGEPAVACAVIVAVPPEAPAKPKEPCDAPGTPSTGAVVADGTAVAPVLLPR